MPKKLILILSALLLIGPYFAQARLFAPRDLAQPLRIKQAEPEPSHPNFKAKDKETIESKPTTSTKKPRPEQTYLKAKKDYQESVSFYRNARKDFLSAREKFQKSKTSQNQDRFFKASKKFLLKSTEAMIKHLSAISRRLTNEPNIAEDVRAQILAGIEQDISWLKHRQDEIRSISELSQLQKIAREIRDHWQKIQILTKKLTTRFINGKIDFFIQKFEKIYESLKLQIQRLEGIDRETMKLQSLSNKFKLQLEAAKENYKGAEGVWQQVANVKQADALFTKARIYILKAHNHLIQARKTLHQIVLELKKTT